MLQQKTNCVFANIKYDALFLLKINGIMLERQHFYFLENKTLMSETDNCVFSVILVFETQSRYCFFRNPNLLVSKIKDFLREFV